VYDFLPLNHSGINKSNHRINLCFTNWFTPKESILSDGLLLEENFSRKPLKNPELETNKFSNFLYVRVKNGWHTVCQIYRNFMISSAHTVYLFCNYSSSKATETERLRVGEVLNILYFNIFLILHLEQQQTRKKDFEFKFRKFIQPISFIIT
jgi:hypothetical protein